MDEAEARRAIVVIGEKPTAFARAAIDQMAPKYRLDLFQEDELLVDVTEHSLVRAAVALHGPLWAFAALAVPPWFSHTP